MPDIFNQPLLREMERVDPRDLRGCVEQLPGKWLHVGLWVALQQALAEGRTGAVENLATRITRDLQYPRTVVFDAGRHGGQPAVHTTNMIIQLAQESTTLPSYHVDESTTVPRPYARPLWQFYTRWWDRVRRLAAVRLDADFAPMPGDDWPAGCPLPKAPAPLSGAALRSEIQDRGHRLAVEPIPGSRCYVMQGAVGSADAVVRVITAQGNCYTWEDDGTIGPFDVGECPPPTLVEQALRSVQSSPRGGRF